MRWTLSIARPTLVCVVTSLWAACSGEPAETLDGGLPDAEPDSSIAFEVTPPAPPAPPVLTPCPEGWREVEPEEPGGVTVCDPWPEGGRQECADDEAHFPGEPGCARIGTPCPESDWAEDLPEDAEVLYVKAGASPDGAGTREAPFGTIAEAMSAASSGTIVALSRGTFDGVVRIPPRVTLWGACIAETLVTRTAGGEGSGTIFVQGAATEIRNLRIGGEGWGIRMNQQGHSVHIQDVLIAEATVAGVSAGAGQVTADTLVVRDTRTEDGDFGFGLTVTYDGVAEIRRGVFERNASAVMVSTVAGHRPEITMNDVAMLDSVGQERYPFGGRGLTLQHEALAECNRCVIEGNRDVAVFVGGAGVILSLNDVVVRDTLSTEIYDNIGHGVGIWTMRSAVMEMNRVLLERNATAGLDVSGESSVMAADVVVRDTRVNSEGEFGFGVEVIWGGTLELERAHISGNENIGVAVEGGTAQVELTDATIIENGGEGVVLQCWSMGEPGQARVELVRALLARNRMMGIYVKCVGNVLEMSDVEILETEAVPWEPGGAMMAGALYVFDGARAIGRRLRLRDNEDYGILALSPETAVDLSHVVVENTVGTDPDDIYMGGIGIAAHAGARVDIDRFLVSRSELCGVQIGGGVGEVEEEGTVLLSEGEVSQNLIGLNVQIEDFDMEQVCSDVIFRDNDRNLDSMATPTPPSVLPSEML